MEVPELASCFFGGGVPEELGDVVSAFYGNDVEEDLEEGGGEPNVEEDIVESDNENDDREIFEDEPFIQRGPNPEAAGQGSKFLETEIEEKFLADCCKCNLECVTLFERQEIIENRGACMESDSYCNEHINHTDQLVLGALQCLTKTLTLRGEGRVKFKTDYRFRGQQVCRQFFAFVFGIGVNRLKNIKEHLIKNGVQPKIHGNAGKTGGYSYEERGDVLRFINNFANQHALVLPGRVPGTRNSSLKLLPSSMPKSVLHEKYKEVCEMLKKKPVSIRTLYRLWNALCPNIVVQKPRTDLCTICKKNTISLSRMGSMDEEEKLILIEKSTKHLAHVMEERALYKDLVDTITLKIKDLQPPLRLGVHQPCSYKGEMHYSFDFAQQIHLPHNSQQVGPLFFLSGYKVALFGIACEPLGQFVLYVLPESVITGKGSNTVISLLHHFLETYGVGETKAVWHADNCAGQNKNNYLFQYASWRTMTGLNTEISISFLPPGHTKFAPDLYFGIFKRKFSSSIANCVGQLIEVANTACRHPGTIIACATGNEAGQVYVKTFNWQEFFRQENAVKIPGLLKYYHFRVSDDNLGYIQFAEKMKGLLEEPKGSRIFNEDVLFDPLHLPNEMIATGLSRARIKYLYEKIREHVDEEFVDILTPKPNEPTEEVADDVVVEVLPQVNVASGQVVEDGQVPTPPPRQRKCGYCKEVGHRNAVVQGVFSCPRRRENEGGRSDSH